MVMATSISICGVHFAHHRHRTSISSTKVCWADLDANLHCKPTAKVEAQGCQLSGQHFILSQQKERHSSACSFRLTSTPYRRKSRLSPVITSGFASSRAVRWRCRELRVALGTLGTLTSGYEAQKPAKPRHFRHLNHDTTTHIIDNT